MLLSDLKNNHLANEYSDFGVSQRLLLTGHSHQAWPNVAKEGLLEAWSDASLHVDHKWTQAMLKAEQCRLGWSRILDVPAQEIALAANTHDLLYRVISCFQNTPKKEIVTTDGEFHSARRQFDRLRDSGWTIHVVPSAHPDLVNSLVSRVNKQTAFVFVSHVFFETSQIFIDLPKLAKQLDDTKTLLMVDVYHSLNAVPFSAQKLGLQNAMIVGGGYKYMQLGEGNAFLRVPSEWAFLRPEFTGWFAEFGDLSQDQIKSHVAYPSGPMRWSGATYDPISHYRAARVFRFLNDKKLTPEVLRAISQYQLKVLKESFEQLSSAAKNKWQLQFDESLTLENRGGFLALKTPLASALCSALFSKGVLVDSRGHHIRFGPAPYLRDEQLERSIAMISQL